MKLLFTAAAAASLLGGTSYALDFDFLGGTMDGTEAGTTSDGTGVEFTGGGANGIVYDETSNLLTFDFDYFDLESQFQSAQVRGPASPGTQGDLIFTLGVNQTSTTSGNVINQSETLTDTQEGELLLGQWYVVINTVAFPEEEGGEIRGQLVPVPEPQTYAMIGGLALLGFAGYRRFKAQVA